MAFRSMLQSFFHFGVILLFACLRNTAAAAAGSDWAPKFVFWKDAFLALK